MRRYLLVVLIFLTISSLTTVFSQTNRFVKTSNGIKTTVRTVNVELQFYSPSVVRVLKSPAGTTFEKNSLSVVKNQETVPFTITDTVMVILLAQQLLPFSIFQVKQKQNTNGHTRAMRAMLLLMASCLPGRSSRIIVIFVPKVGIFLQSLI